MLNDKQLVTYGTSWWAARDAELVLASSTDDANDRCRELTSIHILLQQHSNSTKLPNNLSSNRRRHPFHRSVEGELVDIA